jgi:hypothetical protein
VPLAWLVDPLAVNGADGIHGPLSLPDESDFGDDEELSELGGGPPKETPGGKLKFRGGICAGEGIGSPHTSSIANTPHSRHENKLILGMVVFIGSIRG